MSTRTATRILTTHVGSRPRPQNVVYRLFAQDRGEAYAPAAFDDAIQQAVHKTLSDGAPLASAS